jgi:acetyl-CoA C-acetyltransferase
MGKFSIKTETIPYLICHPLHLLTRFLCESSVFEQKNLIQRKQAKITSISNLTITINILKWRTHMTQEAYIFDALRTPRGKGKKNGTLHEVTPIDLVATLMRQMQQRHNLDTSQVDDIVLGCVTPIGEQGADIARTAALYAGWDVDTPGMQINRFCASGLETVNMAAMKVRSGWEDLVVAGGVESMSRIPMGSDGGAWIMDPKVNMATHFVPQGISADLIATIEGYTRDDVDRYAV